ncbi:MAG TPA: HtaA domain-containing protein, partial [Marmoricola sp.]|nr:HtaA domain-containing protein [Marmoricola sp.]
VSDQFANLLSVHEVGAGASEDPATKEITFTSGSGSYNPANGAANITYSGYVQAGFEDASCPGDGTAGDTTCFWIRIANPTLRVDGAGNGSLTAEVTSQAYAEHGGIAPGGTDTQRVLVTTFDADQTDWTAGSPMGSLTATPDWTGVLAAGSAEASDAGITNPAQPYNGASFAQPFIKQLYPSVKAHFFQTTPTAQPNKVPASFVAEAPAMKVSSKVSAVSPSGGLTLQVSGTGFNGTTNPGDNGVLVGIAESGGLPDVSTPASMSNFAGAALVAPSAITNGAFSVSVTAATAKLDPTKSYSIYTWQAYSHSNVTQDTETPVSINFGALTDAPAVTASILKFNETDGLVVNVTGTHFVGETNPGDNGVYVGIAEAGGLPNVSSPAGMSAFVATAYLPKALLSSGGFSTSLTANWASLTAGKSYAVYTWQAHTHSNTSQDTQTVLPIEWPTQPVEPTVPAATATNAQVVSKKGHLTITVAPTAGGAAPDGLVKVALTKGKKKRKKVRVVEGVLVNGTVTLKAARLSKGKWRATVAYLGSSTNAPSVTKLVVRVKRR